MSNDSKETLSIPDLTNDTVRISISGEYLSQEWIFEGSLTNSVSLCQAFPAPCKITLKVSTKTHTRAQKEFSVPTFVSLDHNGKLFAQVELKSLLHPSLLTAPTTSTTPQIPLEPIIRKRKLIRVLALDGGGIRGVIPAVFLSELERRTGKRVFEMFDLIAGTSTGGLLGVSLTHVSQFSPLPMTAAEIVRMYATIGPRIFPPGDSLNWLHQYIKHPKYERAGFDQVIAEQFGRDSQLSTSVIPTVVSAFDMKSQEAKFFKSWKHQVTKLFALQSTSAAPTYFSPPLPPTSGPYEGSVFIDGGVACNNPALKAYICAKNELYKSQDNEPQHDFLVVSIGTGTPKASQQSKLTSQMVDNWGVFQWLKDGDLVGMLLDISANTAHEHLNELLPAGKYWRFQHTLVCGSSMNLDDVSPRNIANLICDGVQMIKNESKRIDDLIKILLAEDSPAV